MDLRHMRHLVAVAEELHFGKAAERLNMAQPPLSQSIKRLEDNLGVRLLERSRSGVSLTPAGEIFFREAKRTLMQADLTREATIRAAKSGAGAIHVGFIGPAMFRLLPPIIARHRAEYPDVSVRLSQMTSAEQMQAIMEGKLDIAFVHPSVDLVEGGDSFVAERSHYVALIPEKWDLAQKAAVTLIELAAYPMILPPEHEAPTRVAAMRNAFREQGASPNIVQESSQTQTILSLVAGEVGVSLVMDVAVLTGISGVAFRPIVDLPSTLRWELSMAWHPNHTTDGSRKFMGIVREYCAEHEELYTGKLV